jgi:uncharacterized protein YggE
MKRIRSLVATSAVLVVFVAMTAPVLAQYPYGGTGAGVVSGNGVVVISRQPETMRVRIAIQGKGATLKEALASVKTRSEAAKKQVGTMGADKDSVKVETPKISAQQTDSQQMQMQRMMTQQARQGKKGKKEAAKPAEPVLVSVQFTAEWKLDAKTPEDLLIAVHALQGKIKNADLAGMKDAEKLSPEQEEMLEEMESQPFSRYGGNEGPKPGEPVFLFVSRIADTDRDKAIAEAFQKAKTQAGKLAKAAGAELGSLRSLNARSASMNPNSGGYGYNNAAYRMMGMQGGEDDEDGENPSTLEALAVEPGPVKYNVIVNAAFDLDHGK